MPYVIRRDRDGRFVAPPGRASSYVWALQDARLYATREEAEKDRCPGNEYVCDVANVMQPLARK